MLVVLLLLLYEIATNVTVSAMKCIKSGECVKMEYILYVVYHFGRSELWHAR